MFLTHHKRDSPRKTPNSQKSMGARFKPSFSITVSYSQVRLPRRFGSAGRATGCSRRQRENRNQEATAVRPMAGRSRFTCPIVLPNKNEQVGRNIFGI